MEIVYKQLRGREDIAMTFKSFKEQVITMNPLTESHSRKLSDAYFQLVWSWRHGDESYIDLLLIFSYLLLLKLLH